MKKIYKNYTQNELDAQYDLRPLVPYHSKIFDRYIKDSERVENCFECLLDIPYGSGEKQKLDIIKAKDNQISAPSIIFIHGGYWRGKDKSDYRYLAPAFCRSDINFIAINYTLAPKVSIDEIVKQVQKAIIWIIRNLSLFGLSANSIYLSGHSAGGHLVSMILATNWYEVFQESPTNRIRGAASISGLYDLEPIQKSFLNSSLRMDNAEAIRNSPILIDPLIKCPIVLAVGGEETDEYHRQQLEFASAWGKRDTKMDVIPMPGLNHYDVIDHLGMPGSRLFQSIIREMEP